MSKYYLMSDGYIYYEGSYNDCIVYHSKHFPGNYHLLICNEESMNYRRKVFSGDNNVNESIKKLYALCGVTIK